MDSKIAVFDLLSDDEGKSKRSPKRRKISPSQSHIEVKPKPHNRDNNLSSTRILNVAGQATRGTSYHHAAVDKTVKKVTSHSRQRIEATPVAAQAIQPQKVDGRVDDCSGQPGKIPSFVSHENDDRGDGHDKITAFGEAK